MSDDLGGGDGDGDGEGLAFMRKLGVPRGMDHLALTFGLVAVFLVGLGAYKGGELIRILRGGMSDEAQTVTSWDHDPPIAVDVNADGQEDFVGVYTAGGVYLGAFDGHKGKILWRHGPIDIERPALGGLPQFGRQGDKLLINEKQSGKIIQLRDGKEVARLRLPNARVVCAAEQAGGPLLVGTTSVEKYLSVDLNTKAIQELAGRRPCTPTMATALRVDEKAVPGSSGTLWALREGGVTIANGFQAGNGETLRAFAPEKSEPLWSIQPLPANPEKKPSAGDPRSADVSGGRLVLSYVLRAANEQKVLALDTKTGKELWRVPIDSPGHFITGISASPTRVYVAVGEFMVVLDAATGKVLIDKGEGKEEP